MWRSVLVAVLLFGCAVTPPPPVRPASSSHDGAVATEPRPSADKPARAGRTEAEQARYMQLLKAALSAERGGDLDGALRALAEAKQLVPVEPTGYLAAGGILYRAGRTPAAAAEFKRSIELMPGPEAKKMALEQIKNATEQTRDPEEERLLKLAYDAIEVHKAERALPHLQHALDLNPRNARTRYEIGYAFVELGRLDEAIPQFEEARRINPVSRETLAELQYCYAERRRYAELAGVVTDRILVEGESAGLLQELGFTYATQGNTTVAIATFEDNLTRNPTFFQSHYSLGQIYCTQRRDVGKGRAHLDAFIKAAEASKRSAEIGTPRVPKLDEYIKEAHTLLRDCGR